MKITFKTHAIVALAAVGGILIACSHGGGSTPATVTVTPTITSSLTPPTTGPSTTPPSITPVSSASTSCSGAPGNFCGEAGIDYNSTTRVAECLGNNAVYVLSATKMTGSDGAVYIQYDMQTATADSPIGYTSDPTQWYDSSGNTYDIEPGTLGSSLTINGTPCPCEAGLPTGSCSN